MSEFVLAKMIECHDELGEVFLMYLHPFHSGFVVIADPKVAEKVSFHQPDRTRSLSYRVLSKFMGIGIFGMYVYRKTFESLYESWKANFIQ
jgi:hypothetical protein